MLDKEYRSLKTLPPRTKREFYKQQFEIRQPLLEQIIQAKLEKCMKYGQLRETNFNREKNSKQEKLHVIQAPCILGNQKRIQVRLDNSRKFNNKLMTREQKRPKTSNTVIRSRTTEPRIRQKLNLLMREDREEDGFQQNLRPTLHIHKFQEKNQQRGQ